MSKNPWPLIIVGIVILPLAAFAFKKPEHFIHGRRSRIWIKLLGEEGTKKMVRYFSVPLLVLIALFCFAAAAGWVG